jgi:hypothetical protein
MIGNLAWTGSQFAQGKVTAEDVGNPDFSIFGDNVLGIVAMLNSLLTNVLASCAIGYKAW